MPTTMQPRDIDPKLPRLHDAAAARAVLHCSTHKWNRIKDEIEHVLIGKQKFWTTDALVAFVRRQTRKPKERSAKGTRKLALGVAIT